MFHSDGITIEEIEILTKIQWLINVYEMVTVDQRKEQVEKKEVIKRHNGDITKSMVITQYQC